MAYVYIAFSWVVAISR